MESEKQNPTVQYNFFKVSPFKFALMSFSTLGLYEIFWFYKNWQVVKEAEQSDIWPFIRALFGGITIFWLAPKMLGAKDDKTYPIAYLALCLVSRLNNVLALLGFVSFLPLIALQQKVNGKHRVPDTFSARAIIALVVGLPVTLGVIFYTISK